MKVGIATTLSVAGVLAAGAAAFALNSAVLSGSTSDVASAAQSTLVSGATASTVASVTPNGQVAAASDKALTPNSTKVNDTVTTYKVGTAGSVIIDTASGAIVVTDVVPAAGWTAEPARTETNGVVKVHFTNGATRLEFTAQMNAGAVAVRVTTEQKPAPIVPVAGNAPTIPPSLSGDDDDDEHEERHDREHDDEDEEDEDDD